MSLAPHGGVLPAVEMAVKNMEIRKKILSNTFFEKCVILQIDYIKAV